MSNTPNGLEITLPPTPAPIAALLRIARANGLTTLQALADKAGMKRPQLSRYVAGNDSPSLENFLRLCEAAGAKIEIR